MNIPGQWLRVPHGVVEIDGSYGEGGGQIVRTACALSALTGTSCRIRQIRAGRRRPGLRAQHVTAIKGLKRMSRAETSVFKPGSTEIVFEPKEVRRTDLELDTGTAGSIALVLQSLQLAALGSPGSAHFLLRGGTDVPGAPSCDYIKHVKIEILRRMGYTIRMNILKRGYFPRGGGIVDIRIDPPKGDQLDAFRIPEATAAVRSSGISHASTTLESRHVADRQARIATKTLTSYLHVPAKVKVEYATTASTGSALILWTQTEESVMGGSSLGRPEKPAERVADEASERLLRTYHSHASLDPWMGDQILPYLALAKGPSVISVPRLTRHMNTNMWVVQQFLNVRFFCEHLDQRVLITCQHTENVVEA